VVARAESNHKAIHDVGGIKALLSLLTSSSEDSLKQALSALLNISSNRNPSLYSSSSM
jgi:hypothetical protein